MASTWNLAFDQGPRPSLLLAATRTSKLPVLMLVRVALDPSREIEGTANASLIQLVLVPGAAARGTSEMPMRADGQSETVAVKVRLAVLPRAPVAV